MKRMTGKMKQRKYSDWNGKFHSFDPVGPDMYPFLLAAVPTGFVLAFLMFGK